MLTLKMRIKIFAKLFLRWSNLSYHNDNEKILLYVTGVHCALCAGVHSAFKESCFFSQRFFCVFNSLKVMFTNKIYSMYHKV